MQITAAMVKELRERTGAGMMECKKALVEASGDMDAAIEAMRKSGMAKADKKSGRVAAEGIIVVAVSEDERTGVMVEINSETDFVANNDEFRAFADKVANRVLEAGPADLDALHALALGEGDERDVGTVVKELVAKIGEKIEVRRFVRHEAAEGRVATYLHGKRIGVMVEYKGDDPQIGRDVAMHVAASQPVALNEDEVPAEQLEKERALLVEQASESGKPDEIVQKMVEGRMRKHLAEITLMGQPFVKDPDQAVGAMLKSAGADVRFFRRFEVGEGKERREENFAEEVMAQVKGA